MEIYSSEFLSALLAIVVIDLVLAGDNAIVIALAARSLPPQLRTKAVIWGTVGAIAVRSAMTLIVVWLLMIPGLRFIGGLLLISIPIVVWGNPLVLKWVGRFPVIVSIGAGVLAWTATQMMLHEPLLDSFSKGLFVIQAIVYAGIVGGVLLAGLTSARRRKQTA